MIDINLVKKITRLYVLGYNSIMFLATIICFDAPVSFIMIAHGVLFAERSYFFTSLSTLIAELSFRYTWRSRNVIAENREMERHMFVAYPHYKYHLISPEIYLSGIHKHLREQIAHIFRHTPAIRVVWCERKSRGDRITANKAYHHINNMGGWIFVRDSPWLNSAITRFTILHEIGHHINTGSAYSVRTATGSQTIISLCTSLCALFFVLPINLLNAALEVAIFGLYCGEIYERRFRDEFRDIGNETYADGFAFARLSNADCNILETYFSETADHVIENYFSEMASRVDDYGLFGAEGIVRHSIRVLNCVREKAGAFQYMWPGERYGLPVTSMIVVPTCYVMVGARSWAVGPMPFAAILSGCGLAALGVVSAWRAAKLAQRQSAYLERTWAPKLTDSEVQEKEARARALLAAIKP